MPRLQEQSFKEWAQILLAGDKKERDAAHTRVHEKLGIGEVAESNQESLRQAIDLLIQGTLSMTHSERREQAVMVLMDILPHTSHRPAGLLGFLMEAMEGGASRFAVISCAQECEQRACPLFEGENVLHVLAENMDDFMVTLNVGWERMPRHQEKLGQWLIEPRVFDQSTPLHLMWQNFHNAWGSVDKHTAMRCLRERKHLFGFTQKFYQAGGNLNATPQGGNSIVDWACMTGMQQLWKELNDHEVQQLCAQLDAASLEQSSVSAPFAPRSRL